MTGVEGLRDALAGRYTLGREIGRGGMAIVFLAHDGAHGRPVALKVLRPEVAVLLGAERFLREMQIVARLDHPHIIRLYDSGEAAGTLFYTMPYVSGASLRERLAGCQPLPVGQALTIACDVAEALAYAHEHNVLHRDVKPENILLSPRALVADFGIARAIITSALDPLTSASLVVGTPEYMSPEQAQAGGTLDGRSDIYSLGCVLYEMLAGRPPMTGATPQAVVAWHASEAPPPLRVARPEIPEAVEQTVFACLSKRPRDRPATCHDLARRLMVPEHSGS
jgi:eukaryotic-like serine/threonine-protein kinase